MKTLLAVFAALFLVPAHAATPESGTVSPAMPKADFSAGPYLNATGVAGLFCDSASNCDTYTFTAELPADYASTAPGAFIRIGLAWTGRADLFSFTVNDLDTGAVAEGVTTSSDLGFQTLYLPAGAGTRHLQLSIAPPSPTNSVIQGQVLLVDGSGEGLRPNPVGPGIPRYQQYIPPAALDGNQGEPSIGYSPDSKLAFILSGLRTLWLKFPQDLEPALPKACDGSWEDRSAPITNTASLDPIAVADSLVKGHHTARVWVGQLVGVNSSMSYSDDGGESWTPNQGGPPLAATDHQTIAAGPYPASLAPLFPTPLYPNAFYYCGQDIAFASCARSDNGGLTFNQPVPIYSIADCAGIHGHVRVAPDGTVSVPSKACGTNVAVTVSEDAGTTWAIRKVPDSVPSIRDPSMAWATDNTGYFCHSKGPGRAVISVTKDKGRTWEPSVEVGEDMGIKHVMFTHMIAGDPDRATCAYVGTTTEGNPVAMDFPGSWHVYFSTTYDGGRTWVTVNATPNDTVQGVGGIWNSGGSNTNRNLLDFNEITIDENGYPLYGYADGCMGGCDIDPTQNPFAAFPKIVRQIGGKPLYAEQDQPEPRAPADACLAGSRTEERTQLSWKAPENGGAAISGYKVYRSSSPAVATSEANLVGSTDGTPAFNDLGADIAVPRYYYRVTALNASGEGIASNEIELPLAAPPVAENICLLPGASLLADAAGDLITPTGQATVGQLDIRKLSLSQPYLDSGDYQLHFHLRMQSMAAPLPVATWPLSFCSPAFPCSNPGSAYAAENKFYTLQMTTDPSVSSSATPQTPVFRLLQPTADGVTAASRAVLSLSGNGSGYVGSGVDNGLITFMVPAEQLGLSRDGAGSQKLRSFLSRISLPPGVTPDNMPDALAGDAEYTTAPLNFCAPNTEPLARLVATPTSGTAPLAVSFDAAGSSDAEDAVVEYSLDFGDGSAPKTQSAPGFSHTYTQEGFYNATLTVKDARGLSSSNVARVPISVSKASTPPPVDPPPVTPPPTTPPGEPGRSAEGRYGGNPGGLLLLGLALAALLRRNRPAH
ncbi:MAG: PKD domain-containing protein [Stagnimonas sp.]|nr:PKD domain-containing protein [Stagnimonas sp.]